jgi:polysaccharide export outer membrane protein
MQKIAIFFIISLILSGCAHLIPQAGPSTQAVRSAESEYLTLIDLTPKLVSTFSVPNQNYKEQISKFQTERYSPRIDRGDILDIVIYETPPAVLFTSSSSIYSFQGSQNQGPQSFNLPSQMVDDEGYITVPFVGRVFVKGKTPEQIAQYIEKQLTEKANKPQVIVSLRAFHSSNVTIFGQIKENKSFPLTYNISTLLDVLGAVGGPTSPLNKTLVKITRSSKEITIPLEELIRNPELNINLKPGDIITVIYQDQSVTILGATGKNMELDFEAIGINLSQALARAGGLKDDIAHAKGVFVFRYESKEFLDKINIPYKAYTKEGKVPVVYNIDLSKAESVLMLRDFPVKDKDIIYVSTAPAIQLKKFLSIISDVIQPAFMIKVLIK